MKKQIKRIAIIGLCAATMLFAGGAVHASAKNEPSVTYNTHVQNVGWQGYVPMAGFSGTEGKSFRLEGIHIKLDAGNYNLGIEYETHIQNIGWESEHGLGLKGSNEFSGTEGHSLRLEGIKIKLVGDDAAKFDVLYQTHVENVGWQEWKSNGVMSGTSGRSLRLEGIRIKIVPHVAVVDPPVVDPPVVDPPDPNNYEHIGTLVNNPNYVAWKVNMPYDASAHVWLAGYNKHAWEWHYAIEKVNGVALYERHEYNSNYFDLNNGYKSDVANGCKYNYAEWMQGHGNSVYPNGTTSGGSTYWTNDGSNNGTGRPATYKESQWAGNHVYVDFYYCQYCGATSLGNK